MNLAGEDSNTHAARSVALASLADAPVIIGKDLPWGTASVARLTPYKTKEPEYC